MRAVRISLAPVAIVAAILVAGCGSSGSGVQGVTIGAAKTFALAGFQPGGQIVAGRPTTVSFTVRQPDGKPLTSRPDFSTYFTNAYLP